MNQMKNYRIFLKKELVEAYKTYKLLIMGAVFTILGIIGPLTAKMMPDIMKWAMGNDPSTAGVDLSGLFSEPKALDAWAQFYSNIGQLGLIVLVIVFSGMLSSELSKGTFTIILTKGLARGTVIYSKLSSAALIWTGSYFIAFFISWGYTEYFFSGEKLPHLLFAGFCLWLFGMFLLALTSLAAALTKTSTIFCMLAVGAVVIALNLLNIIPHVSKYNPATLAGSPMTLLADSATPRGLYPALAATLILIAAAVAFAVMVFNEKKATKRLFCKGVARYAPTGDIVFNEKKATKRRPLTLLTAISLSLLLTVFIGEGMPAKMILSRRVATEKVTVGAGTEWELAGLLTLPKSADGKIPGVVLVQGSGSSDMDETIYDNKPFREIAEYLSTNGIAVIRYNKRTYTYGAKMSEQLDGALTVREETIDDALLATELLKADPRIDENKVFILGHSLGGMLAPRIHAMGGDYAGLILLAGSPRFLLDIIKDQQSAYIDTKDDGEEKTEALAESKILIEDIESGLMLSDEEAMKIIVDGLAGVSAYYFKDMYENPAPAYIDDISAPFLVMQGADDMQVYADNDFAQYKELLAGRPNATFELYDGLNHLFMPARVKNIADLMDEYRKKANIDAQVLRDIAEWINEIAQ